MSVRIKVTAMRTMSPMPARKPPAQPHERERKPFPIRRHLVAPAEDTVARRNAPGDGSVQLAAEIRRQLSERQLTKAYLAAELGWTAARVNKLLRPDGPTQALTVDDMIAVAHAMRADPRQLLVGAGLVADVPVDLVDAVWTDARIGKASRQMIVRAIELARSVAEQADGDFDSR